MTKTLQQNTSQDTGKQPIIATIWPATLHEWMLEVIIPQISIARMNRSHNTDARHSETIAKIRSLDPSIKILVDLPGPKIRLGTFPDGAVSYQTGETATLTYDQKNINKCTKQQLFVSIPEIVSDVNTGDILLFNDGYLGATVTNKHENTLTLTFNNPGTLSSRKGINSPSASLSLDPITDHDKELLTWAKNEKPDLIALSFVRSASDVLHLREMMADRDHQPTICVKIERHEAIQNLDEIIQATDRVMIARGDLGVEIDSIQLPRLQLEILKQSKKAQKPVVRATQVLESMITHPLPTRAEMTDLYTAITSGADYTMLSGESATGNYPLETVNYMARMWNEYKI